jgi:hypothetical protein
VKDVLVGGLATYRVTKLVIDDEIFREPREKVLSALMKDGSPLAMKAYYLLTCPWCVSIWAAGGLLLLKKTSPGLYEVLASVLASSALTGVLAERA